MSSVTMPPPGGPQLTARPRSRRRKVSNLVATGVIALTFVIALIPLVFLVIYVVQQGSKVMSWSFLTDDLPFVDRLPGGGHGPGRRRHPPDHRRGGADGDSARRSSAASTSTSTAARARSAGSSASWPR